MMLYKISQDTGRIMKKCHQIHQMFWKSWYGTQSIQIMDSNMMLTHFETVANPKEGAKRG